MKVFDNINGIFTFLNSTTVISVRFTEKGNHKRLYLRWVVVIRSHKIWVPFEIRTD